MSEGGGDCSLGFPVPVMCGNQLRTLGMPSGPTKTRSCSGFLRRRRRRWASRGGPLSRFGLASAGGSAAWGTGLLVMATRMGVIGASGLAERAVFGLSSGLRMISGRTGVSSAACPDSCSPGGVAVRCLGGDGGRRMRFVPSDGDGGAGRNPSGLIVRGDASRGDPSSSGVGGRASDGMLNRRAGASVRGLVRADTVGATWHSFVGDMRTREVDRPSGLAAVLPWSLLFSAAARVSDAAGTPAPGGARSALLHSMNGGCGSGVMSMRSSMSPPRAVFNTDRGAARSHGWTLMCADTRRASAQSPF
eukprot:m.229545 g.229545  ORF g.229545 m.229545 type:complete len:305 (-) comp11921_c0_seq1:44-958(-)